MKISKSGHAINFQKKVRFTLPEAELLTKIDEKITPISLRKTRFSCFSHHRPDTIQKAVKITISRIGSFKS